MNQSLEVKTKYLKEPTWEQIESFVKEVGVSYPHFEAYYGIPFTTLKNVKAGKRSLPCKFWEIILNRIVPERGVGFYAAQKSSKLLTKPKARPRKQISSDLHDRLATMK